MRKFSIFILISIAVLLQSCIELKPFRVGENIDIKNRISYMDNLEKTMNSIAEYICRDNISDVAMGNFVDTLNKRVTKDGKYLAFDLKNKLWYECRLNPFIIDNSKWLFTKNGHTIIKPKKNFKYFIYGTYHYTYKGYALFVKVINLKTRRTIQLFAKKICNKKAIFDIDTFHIPKEVVIEPLW